MKRQPSEQKNPAPASPPIVCIKCGSNDVRVGEPWMCGPCYIADCQADDDD